MQQLWSGIVSTGSVDTLGEIHKSTESRVKTYVEFGYSMHRSHQMFSGNSDLGMVKNCHSRGRHPV